MQEIVLEHLVYVKNLLIFDTQVILRQLLVIENASKMFHPANLEHPQKRIAPSFEKALLSPKRLGSTQSSLMGREFIILIILSKNNA